MRRPSELIDIDAEVRRLADGFEFIEGPVWSIREQCLYFSDIPGDTRWRWSERAGVETVMRPSFKTNGMVLDPNGELLVCEHVTSTVTRICGDGRRELLAYHHRGTYLNSPNDIVVRGADRCAYFTDPDFGRRVGHVGVVRSVELDFRGIYRVALDGSDVELLVDEDEFDQPNGLCFSPDESLLYVNDSARNHVKVFDIRSDGVLGPARLLAEDIPGVDGMKCDELGNVWVTGPGGVWILDPEGRHVGTVEVPERVGNLAWGGDGWRTLFLAATTTLYAVGTEVASSPLPYHQTPRVRTNDQQEALR